jgi:3-deoxy-manno-octulosonate cytidylyltransferase (CMP-KDO synthetase)
MAIAPRVLAVIPARYASTRFPQKMIMSLAGKPLVYHVYERACRAKLITHTVIATDHEAVRDAVAPFGAEIVMTDPSHPTGTDRIAEVARGSDAEIIVNVQGDEVFVEPETIDAVVAPLLEDTSLVMATACHHLDDPEAIANPNVVKVIRDQRGHALYFSRLPIPYIRDEEDRGAAAHCYWQHVGLYAYRRHFLLHYAGLPQTPLEKLEKLEQLRVLENGYPIAVVETTYRSIGVDTPEDLAAAERILARTVCQSG